MILRGLGSDGPGAARMPDGLVVVRTAPGSPEPVIDILSSLGLSGSLDPSTTGRGLAVLVEGARREWTARYPSSESADVQSRLGLAGTDLAFLWAGLGAREPVTALGRCVDMYVRWSGSGPPHALLEGLSDPEGGEASPVEPAHPGEMDELASRIGALSDVPTELQALESELRELRADAVETAGDADAQTVEWLRDRQAAESQLSAYRDRARELKARLRELEEKGARGDCPTCHRPLVEHYEPVLAILREEWESVVQDGRWWKRRSGQLEQKPESLKQLEARTLRLNAAVETAAERAERKRLELEELVGAEQRLADLKRGFDPRGTGVGTDIRRSSSGQSGEAGDAGRDPARRALSLASVWVNRISGGRYGGLDHRDGRVVLIRDGSSVPVSTAADQTMVSIGLRAAAVEIAREAGVPLGSIVFTDLEALGPEGRARAIAAFRTLLHRLDQVIVSSRVGPAVDGGPYDAAFRLSHGRDGSARLEAAHEGPGTLHLVAGG